MIYWLTHSCEWCYLPLTMYSYMFDYAIWGLNGIGYHLQNVFWHILAVLAVFGLMKHFGLNPWLAFALSLVFSIHPQRVESVVWISERKDVMCAAFYLWSVFFWVSGKSKRISFILFIAAMLSKSMAISLPFVLAACEFYGDGKFNPKAWLKKLWPFFLVSLIFIPVTIFSQDINRGGIIFLRQSYVLIHNIAWYVQTCFFPGRLSPLYPKVILSYWEITQILLTYAIIIAIGIHLYMRSREFFMNKMIPLSCCFLVSIGPVAGFLPLGAIDYADRYSYIPSVFLWIAFGALLTQSLNNINAVTEKKKSSRSYLMILMIAGFSYVILLAGINWIYSNVWKSYYSVLSAACMNNPPSYIALGARGDLELSLGNYSEAISTADMILTRQKGWETEEGYRKIVLKAKYTKAFASYNLGNKKEALKIFEEIKPDLDVNLFGSAEGYSRLIKMMIDCCYSIGDKGKAEKLKSEMKK